MPRPAATPRHWQVRATAPRGSRTSSRARDIRTGRESVVTEISSDCQGTCALAIVSRCVWRIPDTTCDDAIDARDDCHCDNHYHHITGLIQVCQDTDLYWIFVTISQRTGRGKTDGRRHDDDVRKNRPVTFSRVLRCLSCSAMCADARKRAGESRRENTECRQ